jgi:GGDEF domain-containing protein
VNDRFGHLAGNKVLRIVANGLREHCGPTTTWRAWAAMNS